MSKGGYIDRVVANLKHQYGKDELVAHLMKELSEAKTEIGKLKSEIDHLKDFNAKSNNEVYQQLIQKADNRLRERATKAEKDLAIIKKSHEKLLNEHCKQYHKKQ